MEFLRFCIFFILTIYAFFSLLQPVKSREEDDAGALLALKSSIDAHNKLPWRAGTNVCNWEGVKDCFNGRVRKLVLENLNLTGSLNPSILNRLDQLRVLSFKSNSLSGLIPDLSGLVNLKSIYLNDNNFSGEFPTSISGLHRVKVVVLAGNRISGDIPASLLKLRRLYILYLQDNQFTGTIPGFNQTTLRYLNVSNNKLSGEIPVTSALIRFNTSSFSGNLGLCGEQIHQKCNNTTASPPIISPSYPLIPENTKSPTLSLSRKKLIKIIAGSIGGFVLVLILLLLLTFLICKRKKKNKNQQEKTRTEEDGARTRVATTATATGSNNSGKGGGFSWEGEGLGKLVFCGVGDNKNNSELNYNYSLEDLLKASAETLGRGSMGSTYKAVMESGFIVTVKRLKDARYPAVEEFRRHVEVIGRLRHPNLVPLRAYFQAKEERLLVYDYFPNGSLFSLIHGMLLYSIDSLIVNHY